MKKFNKYGFTMVELLVSLVLITTLSLALFKGVANIQKKEQISVARNSLTAFKTVLNNNIETDFIDDTITELYSCGENCFDITYQNKGTVRLNLDGNTIVYGSMQEEIPKNYKLYSNISIAFYESDEDNNNAYVLLSIPIKGDYETDFDNIKYVYLYDTTENPINDNAIEVTLDYNDGTNKKSYIRVLNGSNYGTLPSLVRSGYKFLGWYTEKNGGVLTSKDSTVSKNYNHTLYAHYEYTDILYEVLNVSYKCANGEAGSSYSFTYTGNCEILGDGDNNWRIKLLTSGSLSFSRDVIIDAFVVGGGSSSYSGVAATYKKINLLNSVEYTVKIGNGTTTSTGETSYLNSSSTYYAPGGGTSISSTTMLGSANGASRGNWCCVIDGNGNCAAECGYKGDDGYAYGNGGQLSLSSTTFPKWGGQTTCEFNEGTKDGCTKGDAFAYSPGNGGSGGSALNTGGPGSIGAGLIGDNSGAPSKSGIVVIRNAR
jgi:uncharacterized repeat protein (TIGR02543 family)/prepilin-type N-terminal cleavage/methylation domain-containing protein